MSVPSDKELASLSVHSAERGNTCISQRCRCTFSSPRFNSMHYPQPMSASPNLYFDPPFRPASFAASLPFSNDPEEAFPPCDAISRYNITLANYPQEHRAKQTCLSASMDAKPPECDACPPLDAIAWTSSLGRLAKFPGLSLLDMVVWVFVGWLVAVWVCVVMGVGLKVGVR